MKSNAVVNLDFNVKIQCIDKYGKVIRTTRKHNKASVNLVDGILRFLRGDFNVTKYNNQVETTPNEAEIYIPVNAQFGRIGVKISNPDLEPIKRRFDHIDTAELIEPTFDTYSLQEAIIPPEIATDTFKKLMKFSRISQVGYTDNNNSECLEFSLYINPGKLVGYEDTQSDGSRIFIPYPWAYYNPKIEEYEVMLTEIGMVSSSDVMLARVLLDGEVTSEEFIDEQGVNQGTYPVFINPSSEDNPITQSQTTTIVLIWRIGIVSVGKNDEFVTQFNISTQQFADTLSDWVLNYISEVTGLPPEDWNRGYNISRVRRDARNEINELLNGNSTEDLYVEGE